MGRLEASSLRWRRRQLMIESSERPQVAVVLPCKDRVPGLGNGIYRIWLEKLWENAWVS